MLLSRQALKGRYTFWMAVKPHPNSQTPIGQFQILKSPTPQTFNQ
jgi:hypothetical protein